LRTLKPVNLSGQPDKSFTPKRRLSWIGEIGRNGSLEDLNLRFETKKKQLNVLGEG